jgi:Fe-S oxidoreductase
VHPFPMTNNELAAFHRRYNDVRADPRAIVEAVGTPIEMERREERTFCCGAGGAHMWMEERRRDQRGARARGRRDRRRDARGGLPILHGDADDGVKSRGDELRAVDVSTLLAESLDAAGSDESRLAGPLPD